jgi:hypothetical protein
VADARPKGQPIVGGGVVFRGRAVDKLAADLPRIGWEELTTCPHEELVSPARVHVDPYGLVHVCQGLCMGNAWRTPLSELVSSYRASDHPIVGPLVRGGPARLVEELGVAHEPTYVDACHLCYLARLAVVDRYPDLLAPRQVYGLR